jgi:hypothetical protein
MAVQHVEWDNRVLLDQNRTRLLRSLRRKLRGYEARFELSSDRLDQELAAGRLRETAEICDWVIAFHTYRALKHGG